MFEFFLALFGGTYYGSKLANEKHKLKEADSQTQKWISTMQRDNERWLRNVVDTKLEYEVSKLEGEDVAKIKQSILN